MRRLPFALTSLLLALPAAAQEAPPEPGASPEPAAPAKVQLPEEKKTDPSPSPPGAPEVQTGTPDPEGPTGTANATVAPPVVAMEGGADAAPPPPPTAATSLSQRGADSGASDWKFDYHGYLRAPMRVGIGKRDNPTDGQSGTTLHYPVIPDDQYLSWQSTSHNKKDWSEMFFSIGNSWAKGTLAVQGFNFTDAGWNDVEAQFGIGQGWVTITPDLGYENFRLELKAGSFWARYGMAGKWDAGEYDTYLFGRTHVAGELLRVEYDFDDANTLWVEHGIGAKRPDPSQFNNARFTMLNHAHVGFKTGGWAEFSAHYLNTWSQEEDRNYTPRNWYNGTGLNDPYNPVNYPSSLMNVDDGSLWIAGLDARFELSAFGYFYIGYSHIGAENALSVAPAVEVLHSFGGGQYALGVTDNYFGPSCRGGSDADPALVTPVSPPFAAPGGPPNCSMGTGKVDTILAQYEFSLTNFLQQSAGGQKFWGEGQDLKATLYGMLNKVSSDVPLYDGNTKIKYGVDLQYAALPWLTFATRYDRLQPHTDIPEQSFSILSPRLVFKSRWLTREQISIQYSRYLYNQRECETNPATGLPWTPAFTVVNPGNANAPAPNRPAHEYNALQLNCVQPPASPGSAEAFGSHYLNQDTGLRGAPTTRPDVNVIKIEASMWW
jgi:hypothetical protein